MEHKITKMMFENNRDFYEDVVRKNFDIKLLKSSFTKRKWCPKQAIAFLAFGQVMNKNKVLALIESWVPNYRAQFWWFVLYYEKIEKRI